MINRCFNMCSAKWVSHIAVSVTIYLLSAGLTIASAATETRLEGTEREAVSARPNYEQDVAARLTGVWVVDVTKTMLFSAEHSKKTPSLLNQFACKINNLTLTFTSETMDIAVATHVCGSVGAQREVEEFSNKLPYSIIYDSEQQTALVFVGEDRRELKVVNWTSVDAFWVDDDSVVDEGRYFFKRQ